MKHASALMIVAVLVISFQSCGETARNRVFFVEDYNQASLSGCKSIADCTPSSALLWLKIGEYEPYQMDYSTLSQNYFMISGKCGTSTFPAHGFRYKLVKGFGDQAVVGQRFVENRCELGQFSVPIHWNTTIEPNQLYIVSLELVGIGEDGELISNPSPANKQSLDVIFIRDN